MKKLLLVLFVAFGMSACESATFHGQNGSTPGASTAKEPAKTVPAKTATPQTPPPSHALKQGSFTVWTVPADPVPNVDYKIVIEVELPSSVTTFGVGDITGIMHGSDRYDQPFGKAALERDEEHPTWGSMAEKQEFEFSQGRARLTITIPGAERLVEDQIDVESPVLGEEQSLSIVF